MEENDRWDGLGCGPHQRGQRGSWFQLNKHHHLQTLATKEALVLGFSSHEPAISCWLALGGVLGGVGGLGQAEGPGRGLLLCKLASELLVLQTCWEQWLRHQETSAGSLTPGKLLPCGPQSAQLMGRWDD